MRAFLHTNISLDKEKDMIKSRFTSHDGKEVQLYVWDDVAAPKAVVKIAHGMAEHSARYDDFAQFLNSKGYIVVMNDHRGHGLTAEKDSLGYEEGDMWTNNVKDQIAILNYCKEKYGLPLFMMGHSYGSFITQAVIEEHPDVKGFIVCGSNYIKGISYSLCKVIAHNMCRNKGGRYPAQLIVKLSFSQYEKKFPGSNMWLNRDADAVKKYNEDAGCGFVCSANFYRTFMEGITKLYKKEYYKAIDASKPLLLIAGSQDPVGVYGKGVKKLEKFYLKKVNMQDVATNLYDGARHEILNETCKQEVYDDVANWLDAKLQK